MPDFFQQYFIDPVMTGSGYNIYNTLAYAVILVVAAFATYKLLKKMKITIDNKFIIGVLPYIILGGLLRALEDANSYGFWFKTPIIYIVIFALAFVGLFISKIIEMAKGGHWSYHIVWASIGFALVIIGLAQVSVKSPFALAAMVTLSVFWALLLIFAKKLTEKFCPNFKLFSRENTAIIAVHMFDASTTFVALSYFPYFEQHVLPGFLINIFGPAVMFVLKFVVVAAVLHVLDKEMKDELQKKKFIKLVILILGLAPGLRNFFRLVMGV
ncbi:MAG: DUF63 family protein [Candidatus Aenigmarchaeota archaeon]|nr:DUF63 family protein [Candidatus Aenigmarchaeota archaeon]